MTASKLGKLGKQTEGRPSFWEFVTFAKFAKPFARGVL